MLFRGCLWPSWRPLGPFSGGIGLSESALGPSRTLLGHLGASGSPVRPFWVPPYALLRGSFGADHLETFLASLQAVLEASWVILVTLLGRTGAILKTFWAVLSWRKTGNAITLKSSKYLKEIVDCSPLGPFWVSSWGHFWPSWRPVGPSCGDFELLGSWGPLWPAWAVEGPSKAVLGRCGAPRGPGRSSLGLVLRY